MSQEEMNKFFADRDAKDSDYDVTPDGYQIYDPAFRLCFCVLSGVADYKAGGLTSGQSADYIKQNLRVENIQALKGFFASKGLEDEVMLREKARESSPHVLYFVATAKARQAIESALQTGELTLIRKFTRVQLKSEIRPAREGGR